jgi:hypothetical protein
MTMTSPLAITIGVLVLELALFGLCVLRARRPVDPLRPRLLPYNIIMILLFLAILATAAHIVTLVTGHQLMPRQRKGIR